MWDIPNTISPPHQGPLGFPELRIFDISDNEFTGSLSPDYFVNWKSLSFTTMNRYEGLYMVYMEKLSDVMAYSYSDHIDLEYKGLHKERAMVRTSYATIDFSGNRFEGQIPESIGLLKALSVLNLSNNAFTGHIPLSLVNLKELESLDLSRNKLSGTIPNGLGSLSFLEFINVSHNQLKGEIPQFAGQSRSSFEGNAGLRGLPLGGSGFHSIAPYMQQEDEEKDEEKEEEEEMLNWTAMAIGYGSGLLFGSIIVQIIASYKPKRLIFITGSKKCRNR